MNLIIDVGNTRIKAAVFENDRLVELVVFNHDELINEVGRILRRFNITRGIISSVAALSESMLRKLQEKCSLLILNSE